MTRDTVRIAGERFVLAQGHDIEQVKQATVQAVRDGGALVDLVVLGNVRASVLVSPGLPVVFTSEELAPEEQDERDTGDLAAPYDLSADPVFGEFVPR